MHREQNGQRTLAGRKMAVAAVVAAGMIAGCQGSNTYAPPPPPEVSVAPPIRKAVETSIEYTGTATATETVDLRARVKGFLEKINFKPASNVKQGEILFVIDKKPFEAVVAQATADLANKEALYESAESEFKRDLQLRQKNVIAEQEFITARANRDAAKAAVESSRATLSQAQLDLSYTDVRAPISGRISRNFVDLGNLVGNNEATLLATIVKDDPIYAYASVSERDLLRFREMVTEGKRADYREGGDPIPFALALSNEKGFPHQGRLDYSDPALDPRTGTVMARGIFPNPDGMIIPGAFVRIRVPLEQLPDALLVPEEVIQMGPSAVPYLLILNDKNTVEQRNVVVGSVVDGLTIIRQGLKPEDLVIINNLQRARPGLVVKPTKTTIDEYLKAKRQAEVPAAKAEAASVMPDKPAIGNPAQPDAPAPPATTTPAPGKAETPAPAPAPTPPPTPPAVPPTTTPADAAKPKAG